MKVNTKVSDPAEVNAFTLQRAPTLQRVPSRPSNRLHGRLTHHPEMVDYIPHADGDHTRSN